MPTVNPYRYLCWFNCEDEESGATVSGTDHCEAAETFAETAQDEIMQEHQNPEWTGDYAIVVKHLSTSTVKRFNILREYEPVFTATEVRS